jgi:transposase
MYRQVEREGKSVKDVCTIFGISRKSYYKWKARDCGNGGNNYRNTKNQPNTKLTYEVKRFIEKEKRRTNYGPVKMKMRVNQAFGVDVSTTVIYRFYKRKRLIRKPQKTRVWYEPLKERLSMENPGEGVQVDVKDIYPHGRREYQFSVFDPFTELYDFSVFPTRESHHAVTACKRAQTSFGFPIRSIQTDNGSEFKGDFHTFCERNEIPHYFIPKRSPTWNGKVERVHRTIDDEFYHNPFRVWKTAKDWLHYYNTERIHLTLDGLTPRQKLEKCHP